MSAETTPSSTPRVSKLRLALIGKFANYPDTALKRFLKASGAIRFLKLLHNKYYAELSFQKRWVRMFPANREKVREYWQRFRYLDQIVELCKLNDKSVVLDVGCGISSVLHFLPGIRHGIDPLAEEYRKVYAYPAGIDVRKGFGEDIPFPDRHFDTVICSNVIDHTTDPGETIREIVRVLKPSGYFVLIVDLFEEHQERDLAHPHSVTVEDLHRLVDDDFVRLFEKLSPWMRVIDYVKGSEKVRGEQIVLVLQKR